MLPMDCRMGTAIVFGTLYYQGFAKGKDKDKHAREVGGVSACALMASPDRGRPFLRLGRTRLLVMESHVIRLWSQAISTALARCLPSMPGMGKRACALRNLQPSY